MQKKLPIGIENFENMIKENYYYVDKTITKWTWFSQSIHKTKKIRKIFKYEYVKIFLWNFRTNKWYDGYRFGNTDIYCPWDVINHCRALKIEPDATPQPYWINTSGNCIVKRFIEKAIQKEIRLELTYNELDSTIENLWSVLFATGYLTQQGKPQEKTKAA